MGRELCSHIYPKPGHQCRSTLPRRLLELSPILLATFWVFCSCSPQPPGVTPGGPLEDLLAETVELYRKEGSRTALPAFEDLLEKARRSGDHNVEAKALGYVGNCYKHLGDFEQSLDHLGRALTLKRQIGDRREEGTTLSHLGLVYWELGNYSEAIIHLEQSISIAEETGYDQLQGASRNNLGLVYDELGVYDRSLEQFRLALELARKSGFDRGESDALGNIGGVHMLLGQFRQALGYYQQALEISSRLGLKPSASQDLGNIALCQLSLGETSAAMESLSKALALAEESGLEKEKADWLRARGSAMERLGRYPDALREYERALGVYQHSGLKRELIETLHHLGQMHLVLGDFSSARAYFRRALSLAEEIGHPRSFVFNSIALADLNRRYGFFDEALLVLGQAVAMARQSEDVVYTVTGLAELSMTHNRLGNVEEAAGYGLEALESSEETDSPTLKATALQAIAESLFLAGRFEEALGHWDNALQTLQSASAPELQWRTLQGKAHALEALGRYHESEESYRKAIQSIETVRNQLYRPRFHSGYLQDRYEVYTDLILLLIRLKRPEEALTFTERLRAQNSLSLIQGRYSATWQADQRRLETELAERIVALQQALEQEYSLPALERRPEAVGRFDLELKRAERDYQNFLDDLLQRDPESARVRTANVPSFEEIARRLPQKTALLQYLTTKDGLVIFLLRRNSIAARILTVGPETLRARIELLRDLLTRKDSEAWKGPARGLHQILVTPVAEFLEDAHDLYIVPHGILHYIPFAVLLSETENSLPMLARHSITYLPAAAALASEPSPHEMGSRRMLAVAPGSAGLHHAREEVRAASRFFSEDSIVLTATSASEEAFKQEAPGVQFLHLATHADFNPINPLLSALQLEPGQGEDGRLEVHEVLDLRLSADLVTLSACETGMAGGYFADIPPGDDFVGLTRAFLYAGSTSVLATLWEVDDLSTGLLMQEFYPHLTEAGKAEALRTAQISLLSSEDYHHPYHWGPFVLVSRGD